MQLEEPGSVKTQLQFQTPRPGGMGRMAKGHAHIAESHASLSFVSLTGGIWRGRKIAALNVCLGHTHLWASFTQCWSSPGGSRASDVCRAQESSLRYIIIVTCEGGY